MLREIRLKNARLFSDELWNFEIAPLTVLCGTNNSGKSTVLKSLVALKQTVNQRRGGIGGSGSLVFRGELVDLGSFETFISLGETERELLIGVTLDRPRETGSPDRLKADFNFNWVDETSRKSPFPRRTPESSSILKRSEIDAQIGQESIQYSIERASEGRYRLQTNFDFLSYPYPLSEEESNHVSLTGMFPVDSFQKDYERAPLPAIFRKTSDLFESVIGRITYLKPLRAEAARFYLKESGLQITIDSSGEFLPHLLKECENTEIYNIGPQSTEEPALEDFRWAFDVWLNYFQTGCVAPRAHTSLDVKTIENSAFQILLNSANNQKYSLADSGFGYSQILPILTSGLMIRRNQILIIEQPELHLNPALQVRLAEFFVSLVRCGKQVIIETHSEHIINTIRTLIAESEDHLEMKCKIYFLSSELERGVMCESLIINPNGTIQNWPRDFFGEASNLSSRLLAAHKQKRIKT